MIVQVLTFTNFEEEPLQKSIAHMQILNNGSTSMKIDVTGWKVSVFFTIIFFKIGRGVEMPHRPNSSYTTDCGLL